MSNITRSDFIQLTAQKGIWNNHYITFNKPTIRYIILDSTNGFAVKSLEYSGYGQGETEDKAVEQLCLGLKVHEETNPELLNGFNLLKTEQ